MSRIIRETIGSHSNIYTDKGKEREMLIEYSLPECGVNNETGMLVLIPGYGGNIDSNVYRHIREEFSDKYNLIVVQCDYFGSRYMQAPLSMDVKKMALDPRILEAKILWKEDLDESLEDFNDMGIMQAVDVVTAVFFVFQKIDVINTNRVILFGTSHGGYLAHLANVICPGVFSHMIDVSGYIKPFYLENYRMMTFDSVPGIVLEVLYDYIIRKNPEIGYWNELYKLDYLYTKIDNSCHILSIQGTHDWMYDYREKQNFIQTIPNAEMLLIDEEDVDGVIFKDTDHGVGLDYIKFLNLYIPVIDEQMEVCNELMINDVVNIGEDICISYRNNRPEIEYIRFK